MDRWKAIIPLVLALFIAFSGTMVFYKWLKKQTGSQAITAEKTEKIPVAVAAFDIAWGTKLTGEMIQLVPFLKESLPPGYVSELTSLEGRVVTYPLKKNEPVTEHRLASGDVNSGGVAALIKPGKRAIAVKGDKVIGISGFIRPLNCVDILVTMTNPQTKREVTKIVLENILVLATGTELQEGNEGKPAPVDVYTLEVTPEEGEKLALAAVHGRLQFALRNAVDAETVLTRGATVSQTLASFRPAKKPVRQKAKSRSTVATVEVIRGNNVEKIKVTR